MGGKPCRPRRRADYGYTQSCENYCRFAQQLKRSMRQVYRAGEKLFIDYAGPTIGPTIGLTDGSRAHVFVAARGASSYTYACATPRETMTYWLESTARALIFFGGVPQLIVPDNPRALISEPPMLRMPYSHWQCARRSESNY